MVHPMRRSRWEEWVYRHHPHYPSFEQIPHYYGDVVRVIFLVLAIFMLVGAPFYAEDVAAKWPLIVVGALTGVGLAALTNPRSVLVMRLNAVYAGAGAIVFETAALWGYQSGAIIEFVLRQAPAILYIIAFYFALKTLRAMLTGMVGKEADLSEFSDVPITHEREEEPSRLPGVQGERDY